MIWLNTGISTNDAAISLSFTGTLDTKKPIVAMTRPIPKYNWLHKNSGSRKREPP